MISKFTPKPRIQFRKGGTAAAELIYSLRNPGHAPARVLIYGEVVAVSAESPSVDWAAKAEGECPEAKKEFAERHPITVVPEVPNLYGIAYDGGKPDGVTERMPAITIPPNTQPDDIFVNVGCIAYRAADDETAAVHQAPFKAHLNIDVARQTIAVRQVSGVSDLETGGPWVVGKAD